MAKKRLMPLDMTKLEILNLRLHQSAGDPASPVAGQIWYDSTANVLMFRNNAASINPLGRANHTGTQTAATISDLATVVQAYRLDQFAAPNADISLASHKLTNVTDPTGPQDAATRNYVDGVVQGFSWKQPVRVKTTANVNLATGLANGQVIDGVTLVTGDRVLVASQTTASQNGIYVAPASGAAARANDADNATELVNASVFVSEGTTGADTAWVQTANAPVTVGTTNLAFAQVGGGTSLTAGNGLTLTGNTLDVGAGTGITVAADTVGVDTAVVVRKFAVDVGDGAATSYTITHNLGTKDVTVGVFQNASTYDEVECDVLHATINTVTLVFAVAPTAAQYRCVVHG